MLVIEENYDKEKLVTEWGFKKNDVFDIYLKIIEKTDEYVCEILIDEGVVYFYYGDYLDRLIHIEYNDFRNVEDVAWEQIDYEVEIPDVIFDMIKSGVIIKKENK